MAKLVSTLEDTFTDKSIAEILELLEDGKWHLLDDIQRKTNLSRQDLKKAIEFLAKYNFVVVDESGGKVRLSDVYLKTLLHKPH
ncbi:MAG: hypothetical protein QXH40_02705 [Candidatus Bathyarchaeia archaeon]